VVMSEVVCCSSGSEAVVGSFKVVSLDASVGLVMLNTFIGNCSVVRLAGQKSNSVSLSGLKSSQGKRSSQLIPDTLNGGSHVLRTYEQSSRQGWMRKFP
jgi:hypothetical protein